MTDMKAWKIATLIRFAKLPYALEEVTETESRPYVLRTCQGELFCEHEIVSYIANDNFARNFRSREISSTEERPVLWVDIFSWAKMNERLLELRNTLFKML
jgi:hypothetical protein